VSQSAREISRIEEVSDVHLVTGEYDIIAQLELGDRDELPKVVAENIHGVTGVVDTVTNVAFEP
ncbi:MAG: Lrp/AsnC ligand binding domain-containing protein, partial [Halobacteria archaeon]|nr:Lrp/AsnC ligand binding domain-containing protein [Halobacteria archaeon]